MPHRPQLLPDEFVAGTDQCDIWEVDKDPRVLVEGHEVGGGVQAKEGSVHWEDFVCVKVDKDPQVLVEGHEVRGWRWGLRGPRKRSRWPQHYQTQGSSPSCCAVDQIVVEVKFLSLGVCGGGCRGWSRCRQRIFAVGKFCVFISVKGWF